MATPATQEYKFPLIPPGNDTPITKNSELLVLCKDGLFRANQQFYYDSPFCRKQTIWMTAEALKPWNHQNLELRASELGNLVLVLPATSRNQIVENVISNIHHLSRVINFAEMYIVNMHHLQDSHMMSGFLDDMYRESQEFWKANKVLLNNTDTRDFEKMHYPLTVNGALLGAHVAYNVNPTVFTVEANKPYRIQPLTLEPDDPLAGFSAGELGEMVDCLQKLRMTVLLQKLFKTLLYSPKYCDIALRCFMARSMEQFSEIGKYVFYGWRTLYLEEKSKFITTQADDRFIFCLEEMNFLPVWPVHYDNPYMTTLSKGLKSLTTQAAEPMFLPGRRGFYSVEDFTTRFETYTGDIFRDLDWTKTAITGSTITACAIRNPLEAYFKNFEEYCEEYYPSNPEFRIGAREYPEFKPLVRNLQAFTIAEDSDSDTEKGDLNNIPAAESDDESPESPKPPRLPMPKDTEAQPAPVTKIGYTDIDMMIETSSMEEFDRIAQKHYATVLKNLEKSPCVQRVKLIKVDTENKYKWKITGLPREVDMFQVNSIPGVIAKFHMACVRAWYNGHTVHGFPTFVTAAMCGMNMDIRWVSCNKDIRDVLLKYYQRGFGFVLNAQEKNNMRAYMNQNPMWPRFNIPARNWDARRYYSKTFMHENCTRLWNPSTYKLGVHYGINGPATRVNISLNETLTSNGHYRRRDRRAVISKLSSQWRNLYGFRNEYNPDHPEKNNIIGQNPEA